MFSHQLLQCFVHFTSRCEEEANLQGENLGYRAGTWSGCFFDASMREGLLASMKHFGVPLDKLEEATRTIVVGMFSMRLLPP